MTIITTHHRYKRPPRKRKALALDVPAVVRRNASVGNRQMEAAAVDRASSEVPKIAANEDRKSAIVTARKPGRRVPDVPDMTPEEHKRRGDAADALCPRNWSGGSPTKRT
jgi:hypothetical protein